MRPIVSGLSHLLITCDGEGAEAKAKRRDVEVGAWGRPRARPQMRRLRTLSLSRRPAQSQKDRLHTTAYVSIRQHTSAYVSIASAYVSIRQHYVSIRQHYVSIRQHTPALRQHTRALRQHTPAYTSIASAYASIASAYINITSASRGSPSE